jgi:hypothetical protein
MVNLWDRADHRLERSLLTHGRPAKATVLDAQRVGVWWNNASGFKPGELFIPWRAALHVEPETEPAFDIQLEIHVRDLVTLEAGFTVQVLYDPSDHTRMVVDPRSSPKTVDESTAWYARSHLAATGADISGLEDAPNAQAVADIVTRRKAEAANQAMAETLKARREGTQSPRPAASAGLQSDAASRIEQLDRLKNAGLIDDAQYLSKRQRLLNQSQT